jgi:PhoH-like ATPase
MGRRFLDTCSLLELANLSDIKAADICLSSVTLQELENIKTSANKDSEIKYRARVAVRALKDNPGVEIIVVDRDDYQCLEDKKLEITNDNLIIASAYRYSQEHNITFYTEDLLCGFIAKNYFGLEVQSVKTDDKSDMYKGYKVIVPTDEELAQVYDKDNCDNLFGCNINEYTVINDSEGNFCDVLRWTGTKYANVFNKSFKSRQLGTCKPLDVIQRMAFDSIINNDVTVLYGRSGSGKTTIPLSFIMQGLESGKYKKCYIVYSYETLKNQKTLGFVKGDDLTKKLHTSSIGNILSTKLGDMTEVERLIMSNQIEIIPTAELRGVEFSSDSIVFSTEAQNLDNYALKTLIQRCKTGSKLILEGDILEQCDTTRGIGLFRMIDVFADHSCFGCVKLKNNYRSEISELADLM